MTEFPIIESIARRAARTPAARAVIDGSGTVTFGGLWRAAVALAEWLAPSVRPGAPVGLCLPETSAFVAALLGAAGAGCAVILLPTRLPAGEFRTCCRLAGIPTVIAASGHQPEVEAAGGRFLRRGPAGAGLFAFDAETRPWTRPGDFIGQFTSGVDDPPKVAVRTHAAVWAEIESVADAIGFGPDDAALVLSSIAHSYGLIGGTLAPLCRGSRVILGYRDSPEALAAEALRAAERERPTVMFGVPVTYAALARSPHGAGRCATDGLSSLRLCLSAGAPLPRDVEDRFAARFGRRIVQDYGTTEIGTISLALPETPDVAGRPAPAGFVGRPLAHVSVRIADPLGREVPPGHRGEVVARSPALARCYLDAQGGVAASEARHGTQAGSFATGDLGWLDGEGNLFLAGRTSSLIHVGGAAVDPAEVESVISRLPGVREVAVVAVPGTAEGRLKAVVVADGLTAAGIRQHCCVHLGEEHVPDIVEFRDAIPRTPAGKVLRRALRRGE